MKIIKYISFVFTTFFLLACKADFFDSITEVEVPVHEPQLVIAANFDATFTQSRFLNWMKVNNSLGILDTTTYSIIDDAKVELYEETILKKTFEYNRQRSNDGIEINGQYLADSLEILANKNYTLKVNSPIFGSAEASQQLPTKVPTIAATYAANEVVDRYGSRRDEVTISFKDPSGEKNYYSVSLVTAYRFDYPDTSIVVDNYPVASFPVDPIIETFAFAEMYFTDASFDGETYTLRIGAELIETIYRNTRVEGERISSGSPEKLTIRLKSVSRDKYLFDKTFSAYIENERNPFAEPVVVHENVIGARGIFSLSVTDEFTIDL